MISAAPKASTGELARLLGGRLVGAPDVTIAGVSTDTRMDSRGRLFVALIGESFDPHDFLERAIDAGAAGILVQRLPDAVANRVPAIVVPDTTAALGALAHAHRASLPAKVVGITGSNGKTTTKEMVSSIFAVSRKVRKTEGNLNNLFGLPLTVLGATPADEVLVLEMGMNKPGEIAKLCAIADPDAGIITNVGPAHVGELGSMEAVAHAKGELFAGLRKDAIRVVNLDDDRVVLEHRRHGEGRSRTFGSHGAADVRLVESSPAGAGSERVELEIDGWSTEFVLPLPGRHNALNAAGAAALATALGASSQDVVEGLAHVTNVKGRLAYKRAGGITIIDDTYNANSASMIAAIETCAARAKKDGARLFAALGEMRELGAFGPEEHRKVGAALVAANVEGVAVFGPLAEAIAEVTAAAKIPSRHEATEIGALVAWLRSRLSGGDHLLVKGSRGAKMERVVAAFVEGGA